MNKQALGLSVLGFLMFTAPAFAQEKKTESKEELDVGKKGSTYKAEKSTKSGDGIKTTTDEDKMEKKTKKTSKGGMETETTTTSKHPAGDSKHTKTEKSKEKTETDASGNVMKHEKTQEKNK